eukprot:TRINITY_DN105140_c0_g1_i1.p1 TRINITY_DN105140_c0_g1~~TRINITY_DN105140_c0_g1_i1.p1  ORF type:complete len:236 (+),score=45.00 TRINITY_DN105140_c0_g1_i1:58-708(+)
MAAYLQVPESTMMQKSVQTGSYQASLVAEASLGTEDVRASVVKPTHVDEETWIACKTKAVFEEVVRVVHLIEDLCTDETCPCMCAGKDTKYSWADETNPKPVQMTAPEYMRVLVDWAHTKLYSQELIPVDGSPFPRHLRSNLSLILRRLFRVYAHVYRHHIQPIRDCGAEAHLNCSFKHFLYFVLTFGLVTRAEMAPLDALIKKMAGELLEKIEQH